MKKLKCTSCGADLEIDEKKEFAICNHCKSKYKIKEDLNFNITIDENTKEALKSGAKTFKHISIIMLIIPLIVFVVVLFLIINFGFKAEKENEKAINNTFEQSEKRRKENREQFNKAMEKSSFNFNFINDNGTKESIFVEDTLDNIISSNKTHERQITLIFNGTETTNETEIINIKHSLKGKYEVSIDYDEEGYVNKIIVNTIKK